MRKRIRKAWLRLVLPLLLGLLIVDCGDTLGPGVPIDATFFVGQVVQHIAAEGVPVARAVLRITRPDGSLAAQDTVDVDPSATQIDVQLRVPLRTDPETLLLQVLLLDPNGTVVFQSNPETFQATTSAGGVQVGVTQLTVAGPSAQAASVAITPNPTPVLFGDSILLTATVMDSAGQVIATPVVRWSSVDPTRAVVAEDRASGFVIGANQRGLARIAVRVPQSCTASGCTGPTDTTTVDVVAPPGGFAVISGGAQAGTVGTSLAQPVVVELRGSDQLPIPGQTVAFNVASGSVSSDTVVTDGQGRAQTSWTLGTVAGPQSLQVVSVTSPSISSNISAAGLPDVPTDLNFVNTPTTVTVGTAFSVSVEILDQYGNVVTTDSTTQLTLGLFASPPGGGLSGTLNRTAVGGIVQFGGLTFVGPGPGYQLQVSGSGLPTVTSPLITAVTTNLALSGRLMFSSARSGSIDLYVKDMSTGAVTIVPTINDPQLSDIFPDWSPGGVQFAYEVNSTIFVANADGSGLRAVTNGQIASRPSWSPDGSEIAYTALDVQNGDIDVWVVNVADTSIRRTFNTTTNDDDPDWSPNGLQIVVARDSVDLVTFNASDGANATVVHSNAVAVSPGVSFPEWSPDGLRIVFTAGRTNGFGISVLTVAGGQVANLTPGTVVDAFPTWSPDGSVIAYSRSADTLSDPFDLWVVTSDGVTSQPVEASAGNDVFPTWAPPASQSGAASIVANSVQNQAGLVGAAVATLPSVIVRDGGGNPLAGATVTFAVTSGGGALTGATQTTNASGIATLGGWTLGTGSGNQTVSATVTGVAPISFTVNAAPDAPSTIQIVSGNNQIADAGLQLSLPLVASVIDQYGNGIGGVTLTWVTAHGSLGSANTNTAASGQAQNTWTLGTSAVNQTVTVSSGALTPIVFSATANFPNPSILLSIPGSRIPLGGSETLTIDLTAPAPVGGLSVSVTSDNSGVVSIGTPGSPIVISEGLTTSSIGLDGIGGGITTVRATATGFTAGALGVEVSQQVLSMPTTLNVPFGGTTSLPLQISSPAPAGGVTITLVSADPGVVSVNTPTVVIPQGLQTANATLQGVTPGPVQISGTTTNFGSAQTTATTTADLDIVQTTAFINESFGDTLTILLRSGGVTIPAPAGGIQVTLVSRDPTCVVGQTPVTIPAGLTQVRSIISYGGSATTSCVNYLVATASSVTPDSVRVTVNPTPTIVNTATSTAGGLVRSWSGGLGANNHGGTTVTISSLRSGLATVSTAQATIGTETVQVSVPLGVTSFSYFIHGQQGQVGLDTLVFTAPGFTPDTMVVDVRNPTFDIISLQTSGATTFSPTDLFQVRTGVLNAAGGVLEAEIPVGPGGPVTATVVTSDSTISQLVTATDTAGTITVDIQPGQARSSGSLVGGVGLEKLGAGTTTVSATIPGFTVIANSSQTVQISAPSISTSAGLVASGLHRSWSASLGASNHGGVTVTIATLTSGLGLVSPDGNTVGSDTIQVIVGNNISTIGYWYQGLEGQTGTDSVVISAPGFVSETTTVDVRPPGFEVIGLNINTTTFTAPDLFQIRIGAMDVSGQTPVLVAELGLRPGSSPITATVTTSDSAATSLLTLADTSGSGTVQLAALATRSPGSVAAGGIALGPNGAGTTNVSATIPGFIASGTVPVAVTVTAPVIFMNAPFVGQGLHRSWSGSLNANNHGGVDVTVTSTRSGLALVSPDGLTVGTESLVIPIGVGGSSFGFWVQGFEGAPGVDTLIVTAPGFVPETTTVDVRATAIDIVGLNTTTTTLTPDDAFQVRVGAMDVNQTFLQTEMAIRAGGQPMIAQVTSSAPTVGQIADSTIVNDTVQVMIPVASARSASNVAIGGVAFRPQTAGMTDVSVTVPNSAVVPSPNGPITVTVSTPAITFSSSIDIVTGVGLMRQWTLFLGAPAPAGGVVITLTSSNPAFALLDSIGTVGGAGKASYTDSIPAGGSSLNFWVYGEAVGNPTVTASVSGYTDGQRAIDVRAAAYEIIFLGTTQTVAAADDPFQVRVGTLHPNGSSFDTELALRADLPSRTATITSSAGSIGQLVTSGLTGPSVTVDIQPGQTRSPSSVASGGVAFDGLAVGQTNIQAFIPNFTPTPFSTVAVTVN